MSGAASMRQVVTRENGVRVASVLYVLFLMHEYYSYYTGKPFSTFFCLLGNTGVIGFALLSLRRLRFKLLMAALGLPLELLAAYLLSRSGSHIILGVGTGMSIAGIVMLLYQARQEADVLPRPSQVAWLMLLQIFLGYSFAVIWLVQYVPYTYDFELYSFERSLGIDLPTLLAQWSDANVGLRMVLKITYIGLPLALILLYFRQVHRGHAVPIPIIIIFMAASAAALLYWLVPACGPWQTFGPLFPHAMPGADFAQHMQTVTPDFQRNAMPSLHMMWALLLLFNVRYEILLVRWGYRVFALLTSMATMGTGQHYFIDLVVAVPLAVCVQAVAFIQLPWRGARGIAFMGGALIAGVWLFFLSHPPAIQHIVVSWGAIVLTLMLSAWWLRTLYCAYEQSAHYLPKDKPLPSVMR